MDYTITYDEDVNGWTSFHSFIPDWMQRLNNRFFTVKNGQLYLHNDENNSIRNNFYGEQFPTTITYIVNDFPSEIKFAKTIMLEANKPFGVDIRSYINDETNSITESTVTTAEFLDKEGLQHAYIRQNEITNDLTAQNVYGLGRVQSVLGSVVTLTNPVPTGSISVGDVLLDDSENTLGIIQDYSGSEITLDSFPVIVANTFVLGVKNARIEGSQIRGYNFEIKLTDETSSRTEIFAANLGIVKSHPS